MRKPIFLILVLPLLIGCALWAPAPTALPLATPTATATPSPSPVPSFTVAPAATPVPTPTVTRAPRKTAAAPPADWADGSLYRKAMRPSFAGDVDRFAQASRYWIDLHVDTEGSTLRGRQIVRYTNQESAPLDEIVFRLLPNTPGYGATMSVSSVALDAKPVSPALHLDGSALYVPLDPPLPPEATVEIELSFEGALPTEAGTGYAQYGYIDGVLALPNAYPLIPVYDDEGWNVELAPPYGDATFTDTALYLVQVTLPSDMRLVASGVEVGRQENGDGTTTYRYASGPMRDFCLAASVRYETATSQVGEVTVHSHYLAGDRAGGQRALDYAATALRVYEQLIGPYPFTELDVVATPTTAGGIEYPGLVVVAAHLYGQSGGFFELATVHEVAHQWWYSLVGNDQLDEPWLDEALTQYTSLLYYEQRYGSDTAAQIRANVFEQPYQDLVARHQDMPVGLPVAAYTEELYGLVVYGKGPLFFDAVRREVGDGTFYEVLRTYFDQHRYGVAYPMDWLAVVEQVSGRSLDDLYRAWISGE